MRIQGEARYDYPAKNVVRSHWVPFAADNVLSSVLNEVHVWFFPGPQALEVAGYRQVGMQISQLVGFEWDAARAAAVRSEVPSLAIVPTSLKEFLANTALRQAAPDWANLDFDGTFQTFASDIRGVVDRLALSRAPRLGLSSLSTRDTSALIECVKALSLWSAILGDRFELGVDLLRRGNLRAGIVSKEPMPTYMICRELAALLLIMRSFGERAYGSRDAMPAVAFREAWERVDAEVDAVIRDEMSTGVNVIRPLPLASCGDLGSLIRDRVIPVRPTRRFRFAYQSPEHKWRWTWYFAFEKTAPLSLAEWAQAFVVEHPVLHHIDFTGGVVGARRFGVCPHCPKEETDA